MYCDLSHDIEVDDHQLTAVAAMRMLRTLIWDSAEVATSRDADGREQAVSLA